MNHDWITSFWSSQYAPHGYCLLWRRDLITIHLVSDILIALAYFSIPIALIRFVRKRDDLQFGGIFWLFATFILACGMTHVMGAWNLWHGDYGIEGIIKLITAAASVPTAIITWKILPQALAIPSQRQLRDSNDRLSALVMERDLAVEQLEQEIHERRKAEAALVQSQKVEAIGQLTGGIAHDFNNLLQAISGNLELIRGKAEEASSPQRWADNALKAVERGSRLSKQLLVFSRVQRIEKSRVKVDVVIDNMHDLISKSMTPSIVVDFDLDATDAAVLTDPNQLEMSVLNLAINARDAMPEGGTLTIATRCLTAGAGELAGRDVVEIRIRDTGTGMTPEVVEQAINPFFTTKEVDKGTGLGLSMAFAFARQSGGTLHIVSEPLHGAEVSIQLPMNGEDADHPAADTAPTAETGAGAVPARGLAILVDDDDDVRPVVEQMLIDLGYEVRAYADPKVFVAEFGGAACALIVLDFMMPHMSGADVASLVRNQVPDQPILFISGYAESASIERFSGARTGVLRKPFGAGALAGAIGAITIDS